MKSIDIYTSFCRVAALDFRSIKDEINPVASATIECRVRKVQSSLTRRGPSHAFLRGLKPTAKFIWPLRGPPEVARSSTCIDVNGFHPRQISVAPPAQNVS